MHFKVFLSSLGLTILLWPLTISAELHYGDTCDPSAVDPNLICSTRQGLSCNTQGSNSTCGCSIPLDMYYDEQISSCVVLSGGNCVINGAQLPCVSKALCETSDELNRCICYDYYLPNSDRFCSPSQGSRCNNTVQCQPEDQLICLLGECNCPKPLSQYFEYESKTCYNKIGYFCTPGDNSCDPTRSKCIADPESITKFSCQCDLTLGYSADYDGVCGRSYNQTCEATGTSFNNAPLDCSDHVGLKCWDGFCRCLNEITGEQKWSQAKQVCASVEGSYCTLMDDSYNALCQDGLECHPVFGPLDGICRKPTGTPNDPSTPSPNSAERITNFCASLTLFVFLIQSYKLYA